MPEYILLSSIDVVYTRPVQDSEVKEELDKVKDDFVSAHDACLAALPAYNAAKAAFEKPDTAHETAKNVWNAAETAKQNADSVFTEAENAYKSAKAAFDKVEADYKAVREDYQTFYAAGKAALEKLGAADEVPAEIVEENDTGSVLSEGNLWIVAAIAVLVVCAIAVLLIVKKKKRSAC